MASSSASGRKLAELEEKRKCCRTDKSKRDSRAIDRAEQGHGPSPGRDNSPVYWCEFRFNFCLTLLFGIGGANEQPLPYCILLVTVVSVRFKH